MTFKFGICLIEFMMMAIVFGAVADIKDKAAKSDTSDVHGASCYCGVFKDVDNPEKDSPLIEKKSSDNTKFSHDEMGEKSCQRLCVSMAEQAKSKAPVVLCSTIDKEHVENLKVKVYSRLCGGKWVYTGKISIAPVCCHKGQPIKCGQGKAIVPLDQPPIA